MAGVQYNMQDCISRQKTNLERCFETNEALLGLQANVDTVHKDLIDTFHQLQVSPAWLLRQKKAEEFLRLFISKVHLKRLFGDGEPAYTADDVLKRQPQPDLSTDRGFWKLIASFTVV
ncbi:uncharacterized protein UTRI_06147 [Ustilago trichophora]|uniref:Uncharacterized protein n=1 Tax=Ustilago trichophora TaxID=86804 RepID=A0A5C3EFD1_9BASI|nr:uncharacterized protein UTRI_06147 [Ustilago trichophora]